MSALAAIAVFPILALLLVFLSKAENVISDTAPPTVDRIPADPPVVGEIPVE